MRKRIALFILGLIVAVCAFWGYQYFSGASFLGARKPLALESEEGRANRSQSYEQRAPNGDLLYLLNAKKFAPSKDETGKPLAGQYDLTDPEATYYTTDGNLLYIRADHGTITVNDRTASRTAGINDRFRGAHLSGNVVLTYGPRESFTDSSLDIKAGQLQVRFEKDLDLNYTEGVVTSPGLVHLRADNDRLRFDGENLTIAFNRSQKKQEIELLRIEPTSGKDNYMLIKDVGRQGFSLDQSAAKTGSTGGIPAATASAGTAPGPLVVATAPATRGAIAGTQPAKSTRSAAVVYKVSLGNNVTATLGSGKLTSDQLFVFFQTPAKPGGKGTATAKATDAATASGPATSSAATSTAATSGPATAIATGPAPKQAPDDLAVTWTGPMEMRPAADGDVQLADPHDIALQAVGTVERPVLVHDETRTAKAGTLQYNRSSQSIDLEPGVVGPVVITDSDVADPVKSLRTLTCQGVTFSRDSERVHLVGPGHVEVPQSVVRPNDPKALGEPLELAWEKALEIDLAPTTAKNSKRSTSAVTGGGGGYVIRRALFTGKSSITNVDFHLDSDALDIAVAPPAAGGTGATGSAGGEKTAQALEHLLATGAVHVKFANRTGAGIADAEKPSGLNADRLEVMTAVPAGSKAPSPSRLLAEGNVVAWAYQPEGGGKSQRLAKQTIYTPKFDVALAPKAKTATTSASGAMSNVTETSLVATDGVIVELEGFSPQTIFAKGKTLTANLEHGRDAALVTLDGERMSDGTEAAAEVSQGERGDNKITGLKILLDQKNKSIDIPGKGTFDFVQLPQKAGQQPMPAEVTWTESMHYDSRTMLAHFVGMIDAHLVGKTDQISKLTCNQFFDVQLAGDAAGALNADTTTTAPATTNPGSSKLHLSNIVAKGNVQVQGTNLDPAGKVLTSLYLTKTDRLNYDESTRTMEVPGPGQLLIQDYRADAKGANNSGGNPGGNAGSGHGDTVFTWDKSLTYVGPTGNITFMKNVYMKHRPLKPFKLPALGPKASATAKPLVPAVPAAPAENQPMILTTDLLVAKLEQSKAAGGGDTVASPIAMGTGGNQQLDTVRTEGHSVLKLADNSLTSERLLFDNKTHIATATAKDIETPAEIFQPGEGISQADEIRWDMTKDKNAITFSHLRGAMQQN